MSLVLLQIYVPWFLQFLHSSTEGRREWREDIGGSLMFLQIYVPWFYLCTVQLRKMKREQEDDRE